MSQATPQFFDALHERWRGRTPEEETRVVRSVLVHLRRRLPGPEFRHLDEEFPPDLRAMWAEPEIERPDRKRPIEPVDRNQFLAAVQREAGLPDLADAEIATAAVFHALGRFVSPDEAIHIGAQLPKGLNELWNREVGPGRAAA